MIIKYMRSNGVSDYASRYKKQPGKSSNLQSGTKSFSFKNLFSFASKSNENQYKSKNLHHKASSIARNKKIDKINVKDGYETSLSSAQNKTSRFIINFLKFVWLVLSAPFIITGKWLYSLLYKHISREFIFKSVICTLFIVVIFRFAQLQVMTSQDTLQSTSLESVSSQQIIEAKRGQIFINNYEKGKDNISLTSTSPTFNIWFSPLDLKNQIDPTKNIITLEQVAEKLSGSLNIGYDNLYQILKNETNKSSADIKKYVVLKKYVSPELKKSVEYLRKPPQNDLGIKENFVVPFATWLGIENVDMRTYPENYLLANTLGYVPKYYINKAELKETKSQCLDLAIENERRGTSLNQFTIGLYGLEQKYCKELGGLNGKKVYNRDKGLAKEQENKVINGYDIHLTIDINLQKKAEDVLQNAMKKNTSKLGPPSNGSVTIMEAKTGKIVAMASNPTFDPNDPSNLNIDTFSSPLRNVSSGLDYEVGSVMKPLTVAAALNEYRLGNKDSNGNRIGVPTDWKGGNYSKIGKPYPERDDIKYIKNADGYEYKEPQSLSNILRDSINTGIADLVPTISNKVLQGYLTDKYRFGQETAIKLPGDTTGNLISLKEKENLNCDICYANYGFGQGFQISPVQLLRAYTTLANNGKIIEPYLVSKITDENGTIIDDGTQEKSILKRAAPAQVLDEQTAHDVTQYLVNTAEQGYHGFSEYGIKIDGYYVAAKTGTSQIGNKAKYTGDCPGQNWIDCNTAKGLYEHTYVGYGPSTNPEYIIVIKLSEPQPGSGTKNFAVTTLTESFKDIMEYTLNYMKSPKDKK
ncbi:MAG: penicillin-binding protein 2 [candidate division SR1 bacterium]|nr:penicillin-binding protein 2 [candidate division SR1 bacterium]